MNAKILVVDDERPIRELAGATLERAGYEIEKAENGQDALEKLKTFKADLLILDIMMPGMDGLELAERARAVSNAAIIFLTAKESTDDKISGFGSGAEDYITKPFHTDELAARAKAVLRRTLGVKPASSVIHFADLEMNTETNEVTKNGKELNLSPTEFSLLRYFMRNPDKVLSKEQILENVWPYDFNGDANVVESYISYLRKKIDSSDQSMIRTLRSVGYMLRKPA